MISTINRIYLTIPIRLLSLIIRKDVRLPVNFQRSMAVEAEAVREARAKVTIDLSIQFFLGQKY